VGEGYCFLINGLSFAAVLGALAMMRLDRHVISVEQLEKPLQRVKEGAAYAWSHQPIRFLLQLMATTSLVAGAYAVMLPVITKHVFAGDSRTLGLLYSASAVGALVAGGMLAVRTSVLGLGRWIFFAAMTFNLGLIGLALSHQLWMGLVCLAIMGFGAMKHMGATNTVIQTLVEDRMRGRVMSFYMMSFVGTMPIGALIGGLLAEHIGSQSTLLAAAAVGLTGAGIYKLSYPKMRSILTPIYEDMGILARSA
jgi:MFS family permease